MQSRMIVSAVGVLLVGWMPTLPPLMLPLSGALIFWCSRRRWPQPGALGACFCLGAAYGVAWGQTLLDARLPPSLETVPLTAQVTVLEPPQQRATGRPRQRFTAHVHLLACPGTVQECQRVIGKVLLSYYGDQPLRAGERWQMEVRLKRPRGLANPGSFNYESWLAQRRFVATGTVRDRPMSLLPDSAGPWHQRWRQGVGDRLRAALADGEVRGVLLALSNGDRSGLSQQSWERFQRYGLNHLVVISGLHVGLVAGMGFLLGRLGGRRCAHISAALLALMYSALAGFALPTIRALIMLASVQLAAVAGRRLRPGRSLSAALLGIALVDPLATLGAGFWLSFAAVAWILYLHHMWPGLSPWKLTLLIQCVLAPAMGLLASLWFGGLGWLAPAANLVAVPVLSIWLAPLCLIAAVVPGLDATLWTLAALPVEGFLALDARIAAELPLWLSYRPHLAALLVASAGLLCLASHPRLPFRPIGLLLLLGALLPAAPAPPRSEFWLLDVGQGLSAVLLHQDFTLVYDTGAGYPEGPNLAGSVVVPFLERAGVDEIDLLVISHGDNDHASGVFTLHRRFPVTKTWVGDDVFPDLPGQQHCRAGMGLERRDLSIRVLSPTGEETAGNNRSCVLLLTVAGYRLLLPGDIEAAVEHRLLRANRAALAADVLVVPHHGSRSSTTSALLAAVAPELALLSRGYRNRFGHPHDPVRKRLDVFDLAPCDTAEQGALRLVLENGRLVALERWRGQRHYYWMGAASPACGPAYNGAVIRP